MATEFIYKCSNNDTEEVKLVGISKNMSYIRNLPTFYKNRKSSKVKDWLLSLENPPKIEYLQVDTEYMADYLLFCNSVFYEKNLIFNPIDQDNKKLQILNVIKENNCTTNERINYFTKIPDSTIQKYLKEMKKDGMIECDYYYLPLHHQIVKRRKITICNIKKLSLLESCLKQRENLSTILSQLHWKLVPRW